MVTFFQIEAKKILKTNGHRSIDRLPQKKKLKIERFVQKMRIFFSTKMEKKKFRDFLFVQTSEKLTRYLLNLRLSSQC